jgi:vesicle coat complex subunit
MKSLLQDVSGLFPDVLKNMQTEDIEQKKLVYLYLINYAKTQPDLVILAVNTFVKDSDDQNPLIRALAIRTMGCIRVEKIIDYLAGPLQKCLHDENPYVRKTAAICVAKLYDLKPELVLENGFLQQLHEMISDSNPMVLVFCWYSRIHLMHPEGRREHRFCVGRYSHIGDLASIYFIVRPCHFHYHVYDLEQAPDRAERVLGVGSCCHPVCSSPL